MNLVQTLPRDQVEKLRDQIKNLDFFSCGFKAETEMQDLENTRFSKQSCTLEVAQVPEYMFPDDLKDSNISDFFVMRDQPGYTFPNHKDKRIPEGHRRLWFSLTDPEPGHLLVFPNGPLNYQIGEIYTWSKDAWHSIANVGFSPRLVAVLHQRTT